MNDDLCLLVTLFQSLGFEGRLLRCAVRVPHGADRFGSDDLMDHLDSIRALLPMHVASIGPICAIERIFEVSMAMQANPESKGGER